MKRRNETHPQEREKCIEGLPVINPHAAGIDIGDTKHDIAFTDRNGVVRVRACLSFTQDLHELVDELISEGITSVAMESTGVYWLCLYVMLEEAGVEVYLVNAKHAKNVTGRKKDDTDAMWLHRLHSCGMLHRSFQPDCEMRVLRTYVRHRRKLISTGSDCARRMQKSLELMNIKLHVVISDLLGKTGMRMVAAILDGERDPQKLICLKDDRIKASEEDILKSLTGIWKEEHLFTLKQAYQEYTFNQAQVMECDGKIEEAMIQLAAKARGGDISEMDKKKSLRKTSSTSTPVISLKPLLG